MEIRAEYTYNSAYYAILAGSYSRYIAISIGRALNVPLLRTYSTASSESCNAHGKFGPDDQAEAAWLGESRTLDFEILIAHLTILLKYICR